MVNITAKMVSDLRQATGFGMMECKKSLLEAEGDAGKAEEILRIKSGQAASKMAGRVAAEGVMSSFVEGRVGALVEVNCETDFVAKDPGFKALASAAAKAVVIANPMNVAALSAVEVDGQPIEDIRRATSARLGENMTIRRFVRYETQDSIAIYLHGSKIGVIVDFSGEEKVGKDVAMHIAAAKPLCVSKDEVPIETLEQERKIYTAQASAAGKPADIVAKMVEGRVHKFLAEVTLMEQPFVKRPEVTVGKFLAAQQASVKTFAMFVLGEGVEKKVVDYAAEVAAAAKL